MSKYGALQVGGSGGKENKSNKKQKQVMNRNLLDIAQDGQLGKVKNLIKQGANVDTTNETATSDGHVEIVELLLNQCRL